MKLLVVGSSGLVGREVLKLAINDSRITSIIAPSRKPLPQHPKLVSPVVDFENLENQSALIWQVDAVICTLGTTMRIAGSREKFQRVDYDYPTMVGHLAHSAGAQAYALNSALGANPDSLFFYNRVKGNVEQKLKSIGFKSLTFIRPGLIGGDREEFRLGERILVLIASLLGSILPRSLQLFPASKIARALLESVIVAKPGTHIVIPENLNAFK